MKYLAIASILIIISSSLSAQNYEPPKNFNPKAADDYAPFEDDVLGSFDWLANTPVNSEPEKRKETNAFLLKWITGSPNVHIEIKPEVVTFIQGNPELLMIFMGGWTKYALESKMFDDKVGGSLSGIEAVLAFYEKNKKVIGKDKNVEKYIKMKESGELEAYIQSNA